MSTDISTPETEVLDETSDSSGAADATKKTDEKDIAYWKQEAETAWKKRDSQAKREREAKERADALAAQLESYKGKETELEELKRKQVDDEAALKGDIKTLRESAGAEKERLQAEKAALKADNEAKLAERERQVNDLRNTYLLKNEVMREIEPIATEGLASTVWLHVADKFELDEDMKPRPKDSVLDVRTFVSKYLEDNGLQPLLRNERAKGMGSDTVKGADTQVATSIPADFHTWDQTRQKDWMGKNPKLALQAAQQALNSLAR